MRHRWLLVCFFLLLPATSLAQNNGFSVGYGLGFLSPHYTFGEIQGESDGRSYNFLQLYLFRDVHLYKNLFLTIEPSLAYILRPKAAVEPGVNLLFKIYFSRKEGNSFFLSGGGGGVYSTLGYREQGTQFMFVLQGAVGYKWGNFFIENRFRHYSNAHLATPNRSINADIISIGFLF